MADVSYVAKSVLEDKDMAICLVDDSSSPLLGSSDDSVEMDQLWQKESFFSETESGSWNSDSDEEHEVHKRILPEELPKKSCFVEDLTCHSMDFMGLVLAPDQNHLNELENVIQRTSKVKVAIIDSSHPSRASPNEYDWFNRKPLSYSVHDCKRITKLSAHGYMCASIVAGKPRAADYFDLRDGMIRGVVPDAQLYLYPVGCIDCGKDKHMLAKAIELAIRDNVRVISMSQGERSPTVKGLDHKRKFEDDVVAQMTLKAFKKGILVCVPAGNDGPASDSILYGMPWCVNIGACTIGKISVTQVTIGTTRDVSPDVIKGTASDEKNREIRILGTLEGISINILESPFRLLGIADHLAEDQEGVLCASEDIVTLNPPDENHWKLLCVLNTCKRPMASISRENCAKIKQWETDFGELYVSISKSRYEEDQRRAFIPEYSSRGHSPDYPEIIMPDLVAPGCNILTSHMTNLASAWIMEERKGKLPKKKPLYKSQRRVSGTSYATPHVSGLFAALLSNRPRWTLSMAKSAAMTTARSFSAEGIPGNEFDYGAGMMQLKNALNPGLVYNESAEHFEEYAQGKRHVYRLNLPSFAASFGQSHQRCKRIFYRTLTNIENKDVTYEAHIKYFHKSLDQTVNISVEPAVLSFSHLDEKDFQLKVELNPLPLGHVSAQLIWMEKSTSHCVVSPIFLYHRSGYDREVMYKEYAGSDIELEGEEVKQEMKRDADVKGKGKMPQFGTKRSR